MTCTPRTRCRRPERRGVRPPRAASHRAGARRRSTSERRAAGRAGAGRRAAAPLLPADDSSCATRGAASTTRSRGRRARGRRGRRARRARALLPELALAAARRARGARAPGRAAASPRSCARRSSSGARGPHAPSRRSGPAAGGPLFETRAPGRTEEPAPNSPSSSPVGFFNLGEWTPRTRRRRRRARPRGRGRRRARGGGRGRRRRRRARARGRARVERVAQRVEPAARRPARRRHQRRRGAGGARRGRRRESARAFEVTVVGALPSLARRGRNARRLCTDRARALSPAGARELHATEAARRARRGVDRDLLRPTRTRPRLAPPPPRAGGAPPPLPPRRLAGEPEALVAQLARLTPRELFDRRHARSRARALALPLVAPNVPSGAGLPPPRGAQGGGLLATSYADAGLRVARLAGDGRFVGVMHVFERADAPPS